MSCIFQLKAIKNAFDNFTPFLKYVCINILFCLYKKSIDCKCFRKTYPEKMFNNIPIEISKMQQCFKNKITNFLTFLF